MCTVVVRWSPGGPVRVLALRDELVGRDFDDPGPWWPDQPDAVGGRDRQAGGTWAATDVRTAVTALVLNRPERPVAAQGAPSRGVLPLRALEYGAQWPQGVDVGAMASFTLVRVAPDSLDVWHFDGMALTREAPGPGTHVVTSGGTELAKAQRWQPVFATLDPDGWVDVVTGSAPSADPAALLVHHALPDGRVFATVFGQDLRPVPGELAVRSSRTPSAAGWTASVVRR